MSQIRIVRYEIRPEIAEEWGLPEAERKKIGVIAQEIEEILPDAVRDDGEYLTIDDVKRFVCRFLKMFEGSFLIFRIAFSTKARPPLKNCAD